MGVVEDSYDQGKRDGRLDSHEASLGQLRIDIGTIVSIVTSLRLDTQRLGDNARASAEATLKLAEAVNAEKISAREALAAQVTSSEKDSDDVSVKLTRRDKLIALAITGVSSVATIYIGVNSLALPR